jgi:phage baseplate assembly protein V
MANLLDILERVLAPIKRRLSLVVVRALVDIVDDSTDLQVLQVVPGDGEIIEDLEHLQPYGLTSRPPKGAPVIVLSPNGNNEIAVALVGWKASRPTGLKEGEVALAHENGNMILLKDGGDIVVTASGDILLGGVTKKLATEDFVNNVYKLHTHPTAPPGAISPPTPIPMPTELTSKTKAE